ncbi:flavodoxin domain-containing protein [Vampirovibrio chlorellavorus]|uniref:flavodoxin domain-containing protein n=1 Tax=Vampirovibrio chlorellavorus TaxID=758823 RepID=UPI0026F1EE72|nr:flavodoxin domain-containing protein [Vampirovibrio chlorellavorus]
MSTPKSHEQNANTPTEAGQSGLAFWYLQYWPAILVGVLLSMAIMGMGSPQIPAFLIWLPPFVALVLLLIAIVSAPRAKKPQETPWEKREREAAERLQSTVAPQESAQTPVAAEAAAPVEAVAEAAPAAEMVAGDVDVLVLWGSETGTAQGLAEMTENRLKEAGKTARAVSMAQVKLEQLPGFNKVLILTSTWGDGEPPSNGIDLWEACQKKTVDMSKTGFSVLALGDTAYPEFCKCGKDFDGFLEKMGAKRIYPRVDCDLNYEANYEKWFTGVQQALG